MPNPTHQPERELTSWAGLVTGYKAGGSATIALGGVNESLGERFKVLCRCPTTDYAAAQPAAISVCVGYDIVRPDVEWNNSFEVIGRVRWTTGKGSAEAEFDVSAWGTQLQLAGGADGVEVAARVEGGDEYIEAEVYAMVAVGTATKGPVYRTITHQMPAQQNTLLRMPNFAERAFFSCSTAPPAAAYLGFLQFADPTGAVRLSQDIWHQPNVEEYFDQTIVAGAHYFGHQRFDGLEWPDNSQVRTIFRLSL